MDEVRELDIHQAKERFDRGDAIFVDVRDPSSFRAAHVPGALHVNDGNVESFVEETEKSGTVIVYCYHGNSSLGGAAYFMECGFADVYSMSGGFESWRGVYPEETGSG